MSCDVQTGSPAGVTGVRRGDILVAMESEAITGVDDISLLLDHGGSGVPATLHLSRSETLLAVSILPLER